MNPKQPNKTGAAAWTVAPWLCFFAIIGIFAFGEAVRVDFADPEVPLGQAIDSLDWTGVSGAMRQREYPAIFLSGITVLAVVTFSRSAKARLGVLTAGLLGPVLLTGPVMFAVAAVSPLMVLQMLAGKVDGEFYGEGTPQMAAAGLWMILCLILASREILLLKKANPEAKDPNPPKHVQHP
jgi:hypothetical protein